MSINRLTLSMVVKDEADRFLLAALARHRDFIDAAVIIDDGSTDHTADLCREALSGVPLRLIRNDASRFANEVDLRKQQWRETVSTGPEWILNLDADEMFEKGFGRAQMEEMLRQTDCDAYYFRLYDMWDETHYREDAYWQAHHFYRPFLVRCRPDIPNVWREARQHCGRFPLAIEQLPYRCHPARIQHFGWSRAEDRAAKYQRYQRLDPGARYGWKEQYESILDASPKLLRWEEQGC